MFSCIFSTRSLPKVLIAAGIVLISGCSPEPRSKKVLLIGIDGVRTDIISSANTPNMNALAEEGIYTDNAWTRPPTVSGPGWSNMLTGVWPDKHRVDGNDFTGNDYLSYPDFLTRIERADPSLETVAVVNWLPLGGEDSGGPVISDAIDTMIALDGYETGYTLADERSVALAVEQLASADPDFLFVYLGNTDMVGHEFGSLSEEYRLEVERADRLVGVLVDAVRGRPGYDREDWLIVISTDHGRRDDGGHGGDSEEERRIFFLASGPSVTGLEPDATVRIVDVATTVLAHLGIPIDTEWELDGRVVGLSRTD
jgi:predicted AlkP superfamily pyrophosphatase or phosphodiesterase